VTDQSIEQRLAALEDIHAIETLKSRYLRACDRKQPEAVRACFTDDAVIDYEGFPLFTDPDAFVEIFRQWGCVPNIVDMHHGQNPIIELEGDRATGAFDLYFFQIDTATGRQTQLAVNYDDEFVRQDDRWLISRTVSRRMSMLVGTVGDDGIMRVEIAGRSDAEGPLPPPR
jgi:ketosteroid isomerase-like protein